MTARAASLPGETWFWDNLDARSPYWLDGPVPTRRDDGLQAVRLEPGNGVLLHTPPDRVLRLLRPEQENLAPLEAWHGDGSGLLVQARPQAADCPPASDAHACVRTWLLHAPRPLRYRQVWLRLPASAETPVEVAVFLSRRRNLEPPEFERNLPLELDAAHLAPVDGPTKGARFYYLPAHTTVTVEQPPEGRLRLTHHLAVIDADSGFPAYRLQLQNDDQAPQTRYIESRYARRPFLVDGTPGHLGRREYTDVAVPPDTSSLKVSADAPLWLQVAESTRRHCLIADNCAPAQPPQPAPPDVWRMTPEQSLRRFDPMPEHVRQAAVRVAQDNRFQPVGLFSVDRVRELLSQTRLPSVRAALEEIATDVTGAHSFYRDLWPLSAAAPPLNAYILAPLPRDPALGTADWLPSEARLQAALSRLNQVVFNALPLYSAAAQASSSAVPAETAATEVLFVLDHDEVRAEYRAALQDFAARHRERHLHVAGHTDWLASEAYNVDLSQRRAHNVAAVLRELGCRHLHVTWHGEGLPRADNLTAAGRQLNRRVSVTTAVPAAADGYFLPESFATEAATLRITVQRDPTLPTPLYLRLQWDTGDTRRLVLLPPAQHAVTATEAGAAGLCLLSAPEPRPVEPRDGFFSPSFPAAVEPPAVSECIPRRAAEAGMTTLDGPFSQYREPLPLVDAAAVTVPIPRAARQVRLWRESAAAEVRAALEYRAAKPYQLPQRAYLQVLREVDAPLALLQSLLRQIRHDPDNAAAWLERAGTPAEARLINHWLPLLRDLAAAYARLQHQVVPPPREPQSVDEARLADARARALGAAQREDWAQALHHWRAAARVAAPDSAARREAVVQQAETLFAAGEDYLGEQLLRGTFLFASSAALQEAARARLERHYHQDPEAALGWAQAALVHSGENAALQRLLERYAAAGEDEHALTLGLLLPPSAQPLPVLLQAAYRAQWNAVYEDLLARADEAERQRWSGYQAQRRGDFDAALAYWDEAHPDLAAALRQGLAIRAALAESDRRAETLAAWQAWRVPGPYAWQEDRAALRTYDRAETVYSPRRHSFATAFRATRARPVRILGHGPLRLEVRPLHAEAIAPPRVEWLRMDIEGEAYIAPLAPNRPSDSVELRNSVDYPGQRVFVRVDVGPETRRITLHGQNGALAVRVFAARPLLPLAVLPPWGHVHAEHSLRVQRLHHCSEHDLYHQTPPNLKKKKSFLFLNLAESRGKVAGECRDRARFAYPTGYEPPGLPDNPLEHAVALDKPAATPYADLVQLLWQAEQHPTQGFSARLQGARRYAAKPWQVPGGTPLVRRLLRDLTWQSVFNVQYSAGLYYHDLPQVPTDSPFLQIRRALLDDLSANTLLLTSSGSKHLEFDNLHPVRLRLRMQRANLPYVPVPPVSLAYRLDTGSPRQVTLARPDEVREVSLDLPAGPHRLHLHLAEPVANQMLRLEVEQLPLSALPASPDAPTTSARAYHVAAAEEPVVLAVAGPALLKVQRFEAVDLAAPAAETLIAVTEAQREVVLPAQTDAPYTLYRIYSLQADSHEDHDVFPAARPLRLSVLAPVPAAAGPPPRLIEPRVEDRLPLAGQQAGTWSGWLRLGRRGNAEDEETAEAERSEEFLEFGAAYRKFEPWRNHYTRHAALARLPADGATLFGGIHRRQWHGTDGDANDTLGARWWTQSGAWSGYLEAGRARRYALTETTFHRPRLVLFGRYLSGHEGKPALDRDVYTEYKADHRWGLRISDNWQHRPWADTRWYARIGLTTNPHIWRLDYVNGHAGWRQLLGAFQIDTRYRAQYYFADNQRSEGYFRQRLELGVDGEAWQARLGRWQAGVALAYELETGTLSAFLSVHRHFGNGRGLRDFTPEARGFAALRRQRWPAEELNRVTGLRADEFR